MKHAAVREVCFLCNGPFATSGRDKETFRSKEAHPTCLDREGFGCRRKLQQTIQDTSEILILVRSIAVDEGLVRIEETANKSINRLKNLEEEHRQYNCRKKSRALCGKFKKTLKEIIFKIMRTAQTLPRFILDSILDCIKTLVKIFEGFTGKKFRAKLAF